MTITFYCPMCGERHQADLSKAGTTAICGSCKRPIVIPMSSPMGPNPYLPRPPEQPPLLGPLIFLAGSVAAVLLIGIILLRTLGGPQQAELTAPDDTPSTIPDSSGKSPATRSGQVAASGTRQPAAPPAAAGDMPSSETPAATGQAPSPDQPQTSDATTPPERAPELPGVVVGSDRRPMPDETLETEPELPDLPTADWRIPCSKSASLCFGPSGCPTFAVNGKVWRVRDAAPRAEVATVTHLSPDGRWFVGSDGQTPNALLVGEVDNGERRFFVPRVAGEICLLTNERLLQFTGNYERVIVWDLNAGKEVSSKPLGLRSPRWAAVTPDGKYLVTPQRQADEQLEVVSLETATVIGALETPPALREPLSEVAPTETPARRLSYVWCLSAAFAPDGVQFAGVFNHQPKQLVCWNDSGKVALNQLFYGRGRSLCWVPDRRAFFVGGELVDGESGRTVFALGQQPEGESGFGIVDADHLVGRFAFDHNHVRLLSLPWREIRDSLAHLQEKGPALLSPAEPVSVSVDMHSAAGGQFQPAVSKVLEEGLAARLRSQGIRVETGRPTVVRLKLAATEEERAPLIARQIPADLRPYDRRRKPPALPQSVWLAVEITAFGRSQPLWRETVCTGIPAPKFFEKINNPTQSGNPINGIGFWIQGLAIPYFIPESETFLALPAVAPFTY